MNNGNGHPVRNTPVARNRYAEGQILHARDLERESDYFLARERQHNALAHGPGILAGLQLIAFLRGTEKAVPLGSLTKRTEIDVMITPGAAIDNTGRLVIVPKRIPLSLDYANRGGAFADGTYRVELLYSYDDQGGGKSSSESSCDSSGASATGSKVREAYQIELVKDEPGGTIADLDRGGVLDGPIDDPTVRAPVILGTIDWNGKDYVGYSWTGRSYVPVVAERMAAPDQRAELDLRDANGRLAFRTSELPDAKAEDPFTPINMTDRFRVDDKGNVWIPAEVGVGKDGVRFREEGDAVNPEPSNWRIRTEVPDDGGAKYGENAKADKVKLTDAYAPGRRELRVEFQRDGLNDGRARVVVGHVDQNGDNFEPAVVVYDRPPEAGGTGTATVEIWGDLRVRGTAFLQAAGRIPPDNASSNSEQLDMLLRQLAGPFAGAFKLFLKTDATWLEEFGKIMATQVQSDATLKAQFVGEIAPAILADPSFKNNVAALLDAVIDAKVAAKVNTEITNAVSDTSKMLTAIDTVAQAFDFQVGPTPPLPQAAGGGALTTSLISARFLAAIIRRLLRDYPQVRQQVYDSMNAGNEQTAVKTLFNLWMTDPGPLTPGWPWQPIP